MKFKYSNIKYQIFIGLFVYWIIGLFPNPVFAHTLKTDGSIGAVMHVNPDDDPVVGEQSTFFIEIKDKNNAFVSNNCDCLFSILQNGKVLYSQPLFQNTSNPGLNSTSAAYYFAERGVYTVRITGQPKNGQPFSPFTINHDLRVSRVAEAAKTTENSTWLTEHLSVIIGGVIGVFIVSFVINKSRKK